MPIAKSVDDFDKEGVALGCTIIACQMRRASINLIRNAWHLAAL